tara:strand:+ start:402 stop:533 length:132 start_codon:yes stop_codon:yes gene_type:complete
MQITKQQREKWESEERKKRKPEPSRKQQRQELGWFLKEMRRPV